MRRLATAALTAAVALPLIAAGSADLPEPYLTDQAGDANGLNDQGLGAPVPEQAAVGYDMADLLGLTFVTLSEDGMVADGLEVRLSTGAPLSTAGDNLLIRMTGNMGGCQGRFEIDVQNVAYGDEVNFEWYVEGCGQGASDDAVLTGITLDNDEWVLVVDEETGDTVITIPFSSLPDMKLDGYLTMGKKITIDSVEVRHVNGEPTGLAPYSVVVPVLDIMRNESFATFRIGQDLPNPVFPE